MLKECIQNATAQADSKGAGKCKCVVEKASTTIPEQRFKAIHADPRRRLFAAPQETGDRRELSTSAPDPEETLGVPVSGRLAATEGESIRPRSRNRMPGRHDPVIEPRPKFRTMQIMLFSRRYAPPVGAIGASY